MMIDRITEDSELDKNITISQKQMVEDCRKSVNFVVDSHTIFTLCNIIQGLESSDLLEFAIPPYECCFIEVDLSKCLYGEHHRDNLKVGILVKKINIDEFSVSYVTLKNGFIFSNNLAGVYNINTKDVDVYYNDETVMPGSDFGFSETNPDTHFIMTKLLNCLFIVLYAMNSKGLVETELVDQTKLNKKRSRLKKTPLKNYSNVKITPGAVVGRSSDCGKSHASPRLHRRRGHFRRQHNKMIWVRDCLVGAGESISQKYTLNLRHDHL